MKVTSGRKVFEFMITWLYMLGQNTVVVEAYGTGQQKKGEQEVARDNKTTSRSKALVTYFL